MTTLVINHGSTWDDVLMVFVLNNINTGNPDDVQADQTVIKPGGKFAHELQPGQQITIVRVPAEPVVAPAANDHYPTGNANNCATLTDAPVTLEAA